ncbi:MAG: hypothetical protein K9J17_06495 [Flavobacteriales bacterium]|nr:hypothetical protein [Flavobacteriales bacterium]
MRFFSIISFLFLLLLASNAKGQDRLLLTNGKIKKLKGTVIYYDHDQVLYQNARQRQKMEKHLAKRDAAKKQLETSTKWLAKQEKLAEKERRKEAKQLAKLEDRKKDFEVAVKQKLETLPPADFEKWKNRELAKIKSLEQESNLKIAVNAQLKEAKKAKKEARERAKFSYQVSRDLVFSILKSDATELIVYSADTLGFLTDGDADVEYNVAEMRLYIKGRQDGRKHSFHDVYIGATVGLASSLLLTYTWDIFYAPIPPAICIAVMAGLRNLKPSPKLGIAKEFLESDPYMDGYQRSAKGRKIFAFTMGAVGGLVVGGTVAVITSPYLQ